MGQKTKSRIGEQEKVHIYGKSCGKMWKHIYKETMFVSFFVDSLLVCCLFMHFFLLCLLL